MEEKHQKSLQIEKAYTFFMIPFFFEKDEWDDIYSRLGKWQPIKEDLYKEDVLYPYIMEIFKHDNKNAHNPQLRTYEFQQEDKGEQSFMFVDRLFGKKQVAIIAKNAKGRENPQSISFTLLNKKGFKPLLFVSTTAKIGIMTFPIEMEDKDDIAKLTRLNYYLHKRNETDKYQCICLNPNKQEDAVWPADSKEWKERFTDLWKESQRTTRKNNDYICWNLNDFVDCILGTMGTSREGEKRVSYFSKYRMHLFTFCSTQDVEDNITKEDVTSELLRLSRCVDSKYMLPFKQLEEQGSILQTYENINFASSIEGAAMIAIGKKDNKEFISSIHEKFNRQYLLVYLLVLIQRYTLQSLERRMTEFESTKKLSDDELWNLIDIVCRIKTNCYFTDVSIYSHHSQFYHLCCNNLHIPETFEEVNSKIELLKLTTDRRMQTLMKEQNANQEKAKEDAEHRQHILNWIVAVLTIAQVMQAAYELLKPEKDKDLFSIWISIGLGAVCAILLIALMWKDIMNFIKKR